MKIYMKEDFKQMKVSYYPRTNSFWITLGETIKTKDIDITSIFSSDFFDN